MVIACVIQTVSDRCNLGSDRSTSDIKQLDLTKGLKISACLMQPNTLQLAKPGKQSEEQKASREAVKAVQSEPCWEDIGNFRLLAEVCNHVDGRPGR